MFELNVVVLCQKIMFFVGGAQLFELKASRKLLLYPFDQCIFSVFIAFVSLLPQLNFQQIYK